MESIPIPAEHNVYIVCTQVSLCGDEIARAGDWVLIHSRPEGVRHIVGQVAEIWQRVGSTNHQRGCIDGILIERHVMASIQETYQMPTLQPSGWSVISAEVRKDLSESFDGINNYALTQEVICVVNVQHNCAGHGCDTSARWSVRQERELTSNVQSQMKHYQTKDVILNTSQMCSQKHLHRFRSVPVALDEDMAILSGATRELEEHHNKSAQGGVGGRGTRGRGSRGSGRGQRGIAEISCVQMAVGGVA